MQGWEVLLVWIQSLPPGLHNCSYCILALHTSPDMSRYAQIHPDVTRYFQIHSVTACAWETVSKVGHTPVGPDTSRYDQIHPDMSRYVQIHPDTSGQVLLLHTLHTTRIEYLKLDTPSDTLNCLVLHDCFSSKSQQLVLTQKIKCAKYTQIWHNFENNEFYCLPIDSPSDSLWNHHMITYDLGFCYINCKNCINHLN